MGRWAKWQVYLFWASTTTALVATFVYVMFEIAEGELPHAFFGIPLFFLIAFSAFLYVERARAMTSLLEGEDALRRSEEIFRAVSEMTSDYAFSMRVEPDGSLIPEWLTGAFENVTGYTPEEARSRGGWQALVHPDDVSAMGEVLGRALEEGGSVESEFRLVKKSGEAIHVKSWSRFERSSPDGPIDRIVGAVSDITERKTLEEDLRRSEIRFAALYERLPVGVFRREWTGEGLEANLAMVEMAGYPDRISFLTAPATDFWMDPSERVGWLKEVEERGLVPNKEFRFKRHDGSPFWARMTAHCVRDRDGRPRFIEGVVMDITEEKQLDEELRSTLRDLRRADRERRQLLTHLVKAKEEERHRVASDIHDDSVQVMTAVAIELERLARRATDPEHQAALQRLEERVRQALGRLRTMVFELRPPALDEEGLVSALRLYLEEFMLDTGITYDLNNSLEEEPDSATRLVLYRIAQEALTNVRKHSGAGQVSVELARRNGGVGLLISDDGAGFDPDSAAIATPGHIGLSEMRERAEMSGGKLSVESSPGKGTRVSVLVPE